MSPRRSRTATLESRCFDPRDCTCVAIEGHNREDDWKDPDHIPITWLADPSEGGCREESSSHISDRSFTGMYHTGVNDTMELAIRPCHTERRCLTVDYSRHHKLDQDAGSSDGGMGKYWFQSLAPDSYGLMDDTEGYQVLWCNETQCLNYYEYNRGCSRFLRHVDYHRS